MEILRGLCLKRNGFKGLSIGQHDMIFTWGDMEQERLPESANVVKNHLWPDMIVPENFVLNHALQNPDRKNLSNLHSSVNNVINNPVQRDIEKALLNFVRDHVWQSLVVTRCAKKIIQTGRVAFQKGVTMIDYWLKKEKGRLVNVKFVVAFTNWKAIISMVMEMIKNRFKFYVPVAMHLNIQDMRGL